MWDPQHLRTLETFTGTAFFFFFFSSFSPFYFSFLAGFIVCNVFFIDCVPLCAVFCLSWCDILCNMCISLLCLIVVPLPAGKTPFAVELNNNFKNRRPPL
jgi:hypothetical protein